MRLRAAIGLVLTLGCGAAEKKAPGGKEEMFLGELPKRASFDFNCSTSKLRYWKIDDVTVGVTGCGKRGAYVESCRGDGLGRECTWILNGAIVSKEAASSSPLDEP